MHQTYVLEQMVRCPSETFQLKFAREAAVHLDKLNGVCTQATGNGLVLLGASEAAVNMAIRLLQAHYGDDLQVRTLRVRNIHEPQLMEPIMDVVVIAEKSARDAVVKDMALRGGSILFDVFEREKWLMRAQAPLSRLIGYGNELNELTDRCIDHMVVFSHYEKIDSDPGGSAA